MVLRYRSNLKGTSRRLRSEMTDSERLLWSRLRGKQLLGIQFYRQKPLKDYVVDFYAPAAKLVVEVDGSQHLQENEKKSDRERDVYLKKQGLKVLRFDNLQVLKDTEAVLEAILRVLKKSAYGGTFSKTFKVTPRFPAEIFGVGTVARSLFVPGTGFQGLFQQSHIKRSSQRLNPP